MAIQAMRREEQLVGDGQKRVTSQDGRLFGYCGLLRSPQSFPSGALHALRLLGSMMAALPVDV